MHVELAKDEIILGRIRMHPILLFRRFCIGALITFFLFSNAFLLWNAGLIGIGLFVITLAGIVLYLVQAYRIWNHTMLLITSSRIIDIHQSSLRKREMNELPFTDIKEACIVEEKTILDRLFHCGTIRVYSTGTQDFDLLFHHISTPQKIVACIQEAKTYVHA